MIVVVIFLVFVVMVLAAVIAGGILVVANNPELKRRFLATLKDWLPISDLQLARIHAALLAKMAKLDGQVSRAEIDFCQRIFEEYDLPNSRREELKKAFREAKDDGRSLFDYAKEFAGRAKNPEVCLAAYKGLWGLSMADGAISPKELAALRDLASCLGLPGFLFDNCKSQFLGRTSQEAGPGGQQSHVVQKPVHDIGDDYKKLGLKSSASDDELKKAYRSLAKKYHPDLLKSQNLSEEKIKAANLEMAAINEAFDRIKKDRKLS